MQNISLGIPDKMRFKLKKKNIYLFFSQATERAGILNPRIWLANHALMTGPAFYDTAHGSDFFPAVHKFRS